MFGHNGGTMGPRQLTLVASEGFSGNGMATIGVDNTFSLLAHLPPPHTFSPYSPAVYAAYLVDGRGQSGFYVGTLRPAGNGMYQTNFRSPVPLIHYEKVIVSLESPQRIAQAPQGPIVMMVKGGILDGLGPVKKIGGNMWGKVKGFVGSRFGGSKEPVYEQGPQPPVQQYSGQQPGYSQQGAYPQQGGYQQQGGYRPNNYQQTQQVPMRQQYNQPVYQAPINPGVPVAPVSPVVSQNPPLPVSQPVPQEVSEITGE